MDTSPLLRHSSKLTYLFQSLCQSHQMASHSSCECGWKSKGNATATRAYTLHMKACPLRAEKTASNRAKRKAMDEDVGHTEGSSISVEQPHKTPRILVGRTAPQMCISQRLKSSEYRQSPHPWSMTDPQHHHHHHHHLDQSYCQGAQGGFATFLSFGGTMRQHPIRRLRGYHRWMSRCSRSKFNHLRPTQTLHFCPHPICPHHLLTAHHQTCSMSSMSLILHQTQRLYPLGMTHQLSPLPTHLKMIPYLKWSRHPFWGPHPKQHLGWIHLPILSALDG